MSRPAHLLPSPIESAALPEVINHTPWPSQYFQHVDPHGDVFHVMVSRVSYSLYGMNYDNDVFPEPHLLSMEEQLPLCEADEYLGAINETSLIQESDYAPYKPKCDVLLVNANAYAPDGKPNSRWPVGFRFGNAIEKKFAVTGPRYFQRSLSSLGSLGLSEPELAASVALIYENSVGGPNIISDKLKLESIADDQSIDTRVRDEAKKRLESLPEFDQDNPIGCGKQPKFIRQAAADALYIEAAATASQLNHDLVVAADKLPLRAPQIEQLDHPYRGESDYPVIGVGPVGRWWMSRRELAGTHDEIWKATQWPKSPKNHDYRYWNCAPEDQQINYPLGGEEIVLINLTPAGSPVRFRLPKQDLQLLVRLQVGAMMFAPMNIDTVIIDFSNSTLSIVRRALISAKADVRQLELGTWPQGTSMELTEEMKQHAAKLRQAREAHHG